jgi:hypothetical protein
LQTCPISIVASKNLHLPRRMLKWPTTA